MDRENSRSRYFEVLIYEDYEFFDILLENIKNNYDYIYIKHDKDTYDSDSDEHKKGDIKKVHIHCCIAFDNPIQLKTLCSDLNYPSNLINPIRSIRKYLPYLIHYNKLDKYQYSIDSVIGTEWLIDKLVEYVTNDKSSENESVVLIFDYIDNTSSFISLSEITHFALKSNIWSVFRRNYAIINNYLREHNAYCERR